MAWVTPVTAWSTDRVIGTTDLNRIEGDILYLYENLMTVLPGFGATIAAATGIVLTNKCHHITSGTEIAEIKPNWTVRSGDVIRLFFSGSSNFAFNTGAPTSGYYRITGKTAPDLVGPVCVSFIFDSTLTIGGVLGAWNHISHSYF
jgi:hypothetical protein